MSVLNRIAPAHTASPRAAEAAVAPTTGPRPLLGGRYVTTNHPRTLVEGTYVTTRDGGSPMARGSYVTSAYAGGSKTEGRYTDRG